MKLLIPQLFHLFHISAFIKVVSFSVYLHSFILLLLYVQLPLI
jgi:hypothetical protein